MAEASSVEVGSASLCTVRELIDAQRLHPHFQPVVVLKDGAIYGHEALIRTPPECPWASPDQLFAAARDEGLTIELELECVRLSLRAWSRRRGAGKLFLNLSASALVTALAQRDIESILTVTRNATMAPEGLVIELTEHEHVRDFDTLASAVGRLRRHKVGIALDDFGDGRSSLRLWSELKPEIVKIDKYFTFELRSHPEKVQTLRALQQISQTFGSSLVAEGIETADDMHLVRDLGVRLGQGWLLGRPDAVPREHSTEAAMSVVRSKDVVVFPERRRAAQQRASARTLLREVAPVAPTTTSEEVFALFTADPGIAALAVVAEGVPIGLIGRERFVDRYAKPYVRELFGRKACTEFANPAPRVIDLHVGIDELTELLTSQDQSYLSEGLIITEGGSYRGLGSGQDLVRVVTESRIEAARHANPLTLLPGNIPLTQHMQRLLAAEREFVACYADLNQFKPFNDQYGYWRGDEMILLAARCISAQVDPRRDFVGHVGGDDFVVLFQSEDWRARCLAIVDAFDRGAIGLYDDEARAAGGVMAEDRHGVVRFHALTTMSIGAAPITADSRHARAEDVANAAAAAKRQAKAGRRALHVLAPTD